MSIFGEFKYLRALDKRRVKIQEDSVEYTKAMKSSPLLGPFCGSEFWGVSLLKI